jgi:hypothetical protein
MHHIDRVLCIQVISESAFVIDNPSLGRLICRIHHGPSIPAAGRGCVASYPPFRRVVDLVVLSTVSGRAWCSENNAQKEKTVQCFRCV